MIEVQVRQHDLGDRCQVDLLADALFELELEQAERVGAAVVARRVGDRGRVQTGVDEDPLLGGLDDVGRDREADLPVEVVECAGVVDDDVSDRKALLTRCLVSCTAPNATVEVPTSMASPMLTSSRSSRAPAP